MKIRWKLTLISTVSTALIVLLISLAVYYFSARYRSNEFYSRLRERAHVSARLYLKQDEMGPEAFRELRRKYMHSLPKEHFTVFDQEMHPRYHQDSLGIPITNAFVQEIKNYSYAETKQGDRQAVGMLTHDNEDDYIVIVSAVDQYGIRKMNYLKDILIICFGLSIGGIFFSGNFFARQALNPIARIIGDVNQITASRLDRRLQESGSRDELNELANTFNKMLDRLQTSFQIQKNFVSNASHQLKTPLTSILGEADLMLSKDRPAGDYKQSLQTIHTEAQRLNKLISRLLSLAKADFDDREQFNEEIYLGNLAQEVCKDLQESLKGNFFFEEKLQSSNDDIAISGNKELLYGALTNVVENASKFSDNQEVIISLEDDENGNVLLKVMDKGIGIPEDELRYISEPFFRSSNARGYQGFGVGLSLSRHIVELHGGNIRINSSSNEGTCVLFIFPPDRLLKT